MSMSIPTPPIIAESQVRAVRNFLTSQKDEPWREARGKNARLPMANDDAVRCNGISRSRVRAAARREA